MLGCHYLVFGKVQGVGFRAYTQRLARGLGLTGWVRNLDDGRVEVLVLGEKNKLSEFEKNLKKGPSNSQVERLESEIYSPDEILGEIREIDFVVLHNGEKTWRSLTR